MFSFNFAFFDDRNLYESILIIKMSRIFMINKYLYFNKKYIKKKKKKTIRSNLGIIINQNMITLVFSGILKKR